jgi:hypothetical protein
MSYTHGVRFSYSDQLKIAWFLFSAYFRPLLEGSKDKKVYNKHFMTNMTMELLQDLLNKDVPKPGDTNSYTDKHKYRFMNIYQEKLTGKNTAPMIGCTRLAKIDNGDNKIYETTKETKPLIVKSSSTSHAKQNHNWTDHTALIICPFSKRNGLVHKNPKEESYLLQFPPKIMADIEDLGYELDIHDSATPFFMCETKEQITGSCLSCDRNSYVKKKNQKTERPDRNGVMHNRQIYFNNPTERFLKDVIASPCVYE